MKRSIVLSIILVLFSIQAQAKSAYHDFGTSIEESGYDWAIHIAGGFTVVAGTHYLLPDEWSFSEKLLAEAFVLGAVVIIVEENDINPDYKHDGVEWVAGGVIAVGLNYLIDETEVFGAKLSIKQSNGGLVAMLTGDAFWY